MQISRDKVNSLIEEFKLMDKQNKGFLSRDDFKSSHLEKILEPFEKAIDTQFDQVDINGDGRIDFQGFFFK